jgi:hypothetical protein
LAEQREGDTRAHQEPIDDHVGEHDPRTQNQSTDGKYQWKKRVPVTKKELADGDIPETQASPQRLFSVAIH